jgi:hypothetical protein
MVTTSMNHYVALGDYDTSKTIRSIHVSSVYSSFCLIRSRIDTVHHSARVCVCVYLCVCVCMTSE